MSPKRLLPIAIASAVALSSVSAALAQRSGAAGVSRPSDSGPSSRVGRTGGTNTRANDTATAARASGSSAGESLTLPGLPRGKATDPLPSNVLPGRPGTIGLPRSSGLVRPYPGISIAAIERVAMFNAAIDLSTPIEGWRYYTPPELKTTPPRSVVQRDSFNAFFGLRQDTAEVAPDQKAEFARLLSSIEKGAADRLASRETRARELFRLGTSGEGPARTEQLAQAERLSASVRDMDSSAWIPSLLIVHSALEREQMSLASSSLTTVLRRHPTLFQEKFDVGALFGDRRILEQQARRYIRSAEYNPVSVRAHILTAYSAWLLNEQTRLRPSLEKLDQMSADRGDRDEAMIFIRAMQAALSAP